MTRETVKQVVLLISALNKDPISQDPERLEKLIDAFYTLLKDQPDDLLKALKNAASTKLY